VWVPAVSVDAVDTIGAGDTFMASVIRAVLTSGSGALDRSELQRIGRDAVAAAAVTVSRAGADLPWARELQPARGGRQPPLSP
jgi:fructokinase